MVRVYKIGCVEDKRLVLDCGRTEVRDVFVLIEKRAIDGEAEIHEGRRERDEVGNDEIHIDRCAREGGVDGVVRVSRVVGRVVPGSVEGLRDVYDLAGEHGAVYAGQALYPVASWVGARPVYGFHARDAITILVVYGAVD